MKRELSPSSVQIIQRALDVFRVCINAMPGPAAQDIEKDIKLAYEELIRPEDVEREARLAGYEGCRCPICGARKLIRSGAIFKCDGCNITLTVQSDY